eukprot:CAMPEP_0176266504 /NCGR_PEP_ID=MMETSP0121_2-20121125/42681_1 /TAXON_ID=160619 /ORGANISM="Kryptoperidinium foliaceum, Strain CCMP 1326" /LENGTH=58 /DNA_ID=CAMNT_0017606545 /DNA_START=87 /DNA_END=259 /DNA_ORIENTATION=+
MAANGGVKRSVADLEMENEELKLCLRVARRAANRGSHYYACPDAVEEEEDDSVMPAHG